MEILRSELYFCKQEKYAKSNALTQQTEKGKVSLRKLTPEENEKRIDELESEMRRAGAEYEVRASSQPQPWYKRLWRQLTDKKNNNNKNYKK